MDISPIYGCSGCSSTAGRLGCGTHGPNKIVILDPLAPPPAFRMAEVDATRLATLEERDRCRKVAADHPWKCKGKDCNCAQQIAHDIMDVPGL